MKKRICLLLTLIISIFVGIKSVGAAKELTCFYDQQVYWDIMLYQNANGDLFVANADFSSFDIKEWFDNTSINWRICNSKDTVGIGTSCQFDFESTTVYTNGQLTECPSYIDGDARILEGTNNVFKFYDKGAFWFGIGTNPLTDKKYEAHRIFKNEFSDEVNNEIESNDWFAKCVYDKEVAGAAAKETLFLYFNAEKSLLYNETQNIKIEDNSISYDVQTLKELYDSKICPMFLYEEYIDDQYISVSDKTYHIQNPGNGSFGCLPMGMGAANSSSQCVYRFKFNEDRTEFYESTTLPPIDEIDDCSDLFSDDFIKVIDDFMFYVKIFVPILLIGYGIFDFTKAIFSGSEDDMKKSQKLFFSRLIGALLVFISPIIIKLLLELGNNVWDVINPNTCVR